jgi:hypothetical protein
MATDDARDRALAGLRRLVAVEQGSIIPHLVESAPFVSWAGADEALVTQDVVREQLEHVEWLTDVLLDAGGVPPPRKPAMSLASIHYVDVESLIPRILDEKRRIITTYEANVPSLSVSPEATAVAARCLERHRRHLERIEATFAGAAT